MRKLICLSILSLLLIAQQLYAQKVSNVDYADIKKKVEDTTSGLYYPSLLKRFQAFDTTLTLTDMKYIYYGNVYYEHYNPYNESKDEKKFLELYKAKKYSDAIVYGLEVFKYNPVHIRLLYNLIVCHDKIGDRVTAQKYADLYFGLLSIIYSSGDGKSLNTAFVVIKVPDEYDIIGDMELQITKQALVQDVDALTINTKLQKPDKGQKKIKELYFNVRMPLLYLHQEFKKGNE